jgi:hypothetical protein
MTQMPPSPFLSSAVVTSMAEALPATVPGKEHPVAGRFVLNERAFMESIEPPPLFLQRAG